MASIKIKEPGKLSLLVYAYFLKKIIIFERFTSY